MSAPDPRDFAHLHVHTDYSLLDGCSRIDRLCARARALGMSALAMTDHGNLFGAIEFYQTARKAGLKPIIGCEIYLVHDHKMADRPRREKKRNDDIDDVPDLATLQPSDFPKFQIHHKTILAANFEGYQNLSKLISLAHTQGQYYRPRVGLEELAAHSRGLIGLSGCMNGVASQYLIYNDYEKAREVTGQFVDIFGKDRYFIELQDHGLTFQRRIIPNLLSLAREFGLLAVCTNDVHYVLREDSAPHDALLCIQTGKKISEPDRMRYPCQEFYLKSREEMAAVFRECPETLDHTLRVAERVDLKIPFGENHYPVFPLPPEIDPPVGRDDFDRILDFYLHEQNKVNRQNRKPEIPPLSEERRQAFREKGLFLFDLCRQGLLHRYGIDYQACRRARPAPPADELKALAEPGRRREANPDFDFHVCNKLDYELAIITGTGFVDYFLITWDFIDWARRQGIPVGPGRGSGAGCLVSFLLRITDIDPLRFGLLFERMLSLERVSPPDFDVDFCMRRRDEVVDYVRSKYGRDRVANIITFGTFGAKMIVRDLARVNEVPYAEADRVAKMVPDELNISLEEAVEKSAELRAEITTNPVASKIISEGKVIEGMVRNTGKHACGIIIGDQPLTNLVPVTLQEGDLTTQYPKGPVEELGMLKADFLGLKTLTVLADAQAHIRRTRRLPSFDIEKVSLDDSLTYELLNSGRTTGVFQLESGGMQALCRQLGLSSFEEIIALIALYRPGPMQFIPNYIRGKKDASTIEVPHPLLKDLVSETYGVLVYQEQVMEVARIIAGYTLGGADLLRRAMGKKIKEVMDAQRDTFVQGAKAHRDLSESAAGRIFDILAKFAEYGFNKSHSAAYAMLSYRTAWLKANYPVEFMAALLSSELGNADKVAHFIDECSALSIPVLGPDINESRESFTPVLNPAPSAPRGTGGSPVSSPSAPRGTGGSPVSSPSGPANSPGSLPHRIDGQIRFGLAAIKGVGDSAAQTILAERDQHGPFSGFLEFLRRVDPKAVNRRVLECLIKTGAFDSLGEDRGALLQDLDGAMSRAQSDRRDAEKGQLGLFDDAFASPPGAPPSRGSSPGSPPPGRHTQSSPAPSSSLPRAEMLRFEKELLGFYLSGHPLDGFGPLADVLNSLDSDTLAEVPDRTPFRLCGVLSGVVKRLTRKDNKPWAQFNLSTRSASFALTLFNEPFEKFGHLLPTAGEGLFLVHGTVSRRDGDTTLRVHELLSLEKVLPSLIRKITWLLEPEAGPEAAAFLHDLRSAIDEQRGPTRIEIGWVLHPGEVALSDTASSLSWNVAPDRFRDLRRRPAVAGAWIEPVPVPDREPKPAWARRARN